MEDRLSNRSSLKDPNDPEDEELLIDIDQPD